MKTVIYDDNHLHSGLRPQLSKVFELTSSLEKNNWFEKVETKYARQSGKGTQEYGWISFRGFTVRRGRHRRKVMFNALKPREKKLAFIVAGLIALFLLQGIHHPIPSLRSGQDTVTKFKYKIPGLINRNEISVIKMKLKNKHIMNI